MGRRLADVPLNEVSSIADFALNRRHSRASIPDWEREDLSAMPVRALLDGMTVASGTGAAVLGHPLNPLVWLAETLVRHGGRLRRGEMILTGTCTGITKIRPGQTFAGCFADFSPVQVQMA